MQTRRLDPWRLLVPRQGAMLVDALVYCTPEMRIEESALRQLADVASLKGIKRALATPDIHQGYGAPIGSVAGLRDYVCPAAVGYDINCGMRLLASPWPADELPVKALAERTARLVPLGEGKSGSLRLSTGRFRQVLEGGLKGLRELRPMGGPHFEGWDDDLAADDIRAVEDEGSLPASSVYLSARAVERGLPQLGTLGGGNHFIEFQRVEEVRDRKAASKLGVAEGALVVMIHSGSRGLGHQVGSEYMPLAWERYSSIAPNRQLGLFPLDSPEAREYLDCMRCAANFAYANRQVMANLVRLAFRELLGEAPLRTVYDVAHNIAKKELHGHMKLWVHRKGATRAFPPERMAVPPFDEIGQPVLIPGSMGTASFLLLGTRRAEESLFSVNHGAGRVLSRTAAAGKRRRGRVVREAAVSDEEFARAMRGVHLICADRRSVKEEAPQAYKDIDSVVRAVEGAGLARVVARMRPLAVLKG